MISKHITKTHPKALSRHLRYAHKGQKRGLYLKDCVSVLLAFSTFTPLGPRNPQGQTSLLSKTTTKTVRFDFPSTVFWKLITVRTGSLQPPNQIIQRNTSIIEFNYDGNILATVIMSNHLSVKQANKNHIHSDPQLPRSWVCCLGALHKNWSRGLKKWLSG